MLPEEDLQLRPYQKEGALFLIRQQRAVLADDPGLGKTVQALTAARNLTDDRILVVAPKSASGVWVDEVKKWQLTDAGVYVGYGRKASALDAPVVITNYRLMQEVIAKGGRNWPVVIFDEAHKLRNPRARTLFRTARALRAQHGLFFLTGTPIFKSAADMWTLFSLIDHERFSSYWAFAKRWTQMYTQRIPGGRSVPVVEGVRDPELFKEAFRDLYLRRTRDLLGDQLPEKTRQRIPLVMTPKQRRHYNDLAKDLMTEVEDGTFLMTPTVLAKLTRLRQLLVAPRILGIDDDGAAIEALADIETPAVIFTPWAEAVPFIADALREVPVHIITGATRDPGGVARVFNDSDDSRRVLISTIKMGESWSAHSAANAYFLGFDWNPSTHEQAESRLHRPGQMNPVVCRYFTHRGTVDTHVMQILRNKVRLQELLMSPVDLLQGVVLP